MSSLSLAGARLERLIEPVGRVNRRRTDYVAGAPPGRCHQFQGSPATDRRSGRAFHTLQEPSARQRRTCRDAIRTRSSLSQAKASAAAAGLS